MKLRLYPGHAHHAQPRVHTNELKNKNRHTTSDSAAAHVARHELAKAVAELRVVQRQSIVLAGINFALQHSD